MNKALLIVLVMLMPASAAHACIWDRDTLAMERARFPEVNELIVGYFPRHSPAYYEWRKEQVLAIPLDQRTPSGFDDLAVSYDKLGEHEQAIATMLEKFERFPDQGLYETHANLGTFYIHNGDLEQGAQYIGSAIEINPDAHFGREVYQKLLVEYVLKQRATGNHLPLEGYTNFSGFADFVVKDTQPDANPFSGGGTEYEDRNAELKRAIKGVLGMMRFGNYDSPVLLEVLGDLLMTQSEGEHGLQRLAARAYIKASYEVEDAELAKVYREKAEVALRMQEGVSLASIEAKLKEEIAEADTYFAKIEADEKAWIASGKDVDVLFIEKYYNDAPEYSQSLIADARDRIHVMPLGDKMFYFAMAIGLSVLICVVVIVVRIRRMRARRRGIAARLQGA